MILILFILLLLAFVLHNDLRTAWIKACLALSVLVVMLTECLSLLSLLNRFTLLAFYTIAIVFLIIYLYRRRNSLWAQMKEKSRMRLFTSEYLIISVSIILLITTAATALISAPNNWDSMVYHLARIPYWIQQGHVGHFPAHVSRQLGFPPLSEFILMHSILLYDTDRLLNLYQCFFALSSAICVSEIAKQLNFSPKVQISAILLTASLPMLIMQSSSTQNDLVNAFFLLTALLFIIRYKRSNNSKALLYIAISAALALLTKGTAYIYLLPMAIWTVILFLKSRSKSWSMVGIGLAIIFVINVSHWNRNDTVFNNFLGPDTHTMNYFHPKAIASNLIRNSVMECATNVDALNSFLASATYKTHQLLGIDQNDPRTTWSGSMSFEVRPLRLQEDYANNPIHFLLLVISLSYLMWNFKKSKKYLSYCICIVSTFILLSSLLEWQIWHNRLHLPFMIMTIPISAYVLSRNRILNYSVLTVLSLFAIYAAVNNESRKLVGKNAIWKKSRTEQYFSTRTSMQKDWETINTKLATYSKGNLGIIGSAAIWDYPTWFMLNKENRFYIENIKVENASTSLESKSIQPDIILVNKVNTEEVINHKGVEYRRTLQSGELALYEK